MPEMSSYEPGMFCWAELSTSDARAAKSFYTSLFGWAVHEMPMGDQGSYTMFQKNGKDVAAMYEQMAEEKSEGIPPHWNNYIAVSSADAAAKKAKSLGAIIPAGPFDAMEVGRMAFVRDPQHAMFAIWEAKSHIGARLFGEPGAMCWNELYTPDVEASRDFYSALFGWKLKPSPEYTEVYVGDRPIAGMMQISEQMRGMPPMWIPYFAVTDADAVVKRATGAQVYMPPTTLEHVGRFSVMADPQRATFAIIALAHP